MKQLLYISIVALFISMGCGKKITERTEPIDEEICLESGLCYWNLKIGNGIKADTGMTVYFHSFFWFSIDQITWDTVSGKVVQKYYMGFTIGEDPKYISGLHQGITGMRVGGKRRIIIPPELGHGSESVNDVIPPNATLKFEVELDRLMTN